VARVIGDEGEILTIADETESRRAGIGRVFSPMLMARWSHAARIGLARSGGRDEPRTREYSAAGLLAEGVRGAI